ncbi:mRNA-decapping enzyme-like protein [Diospyros lotus]|uniref:mRNA-decapping enzyme-like protein n=1 Tax=Diospyros lotus TaxID=55363 RepID=UPI0022525362|nr:mRNA-decapping enzyme-like protein [Diospyros lotus]
MSAAQPGRLVPATINLAMDHSIEEIILVAAYVKLYEFIIALRQWTETDVEGHLFVIKRNTQPHFLLIILNSRNTGYFVEIIDGHFELNLRQPFLRYQNGVRRIYGIWFSQTQEFQRAAEVFTRIVSTYAQPPSSR